MFSSSMTLARQCVALAKAWPSLDQGRPRHRQRLPSNVPDHIARKGAEEKRQVVEASRI